MLIEELIKRQGIVFDYGSFFSVLRECLWDLKDVNSDLIGLDLVLAEDIAEML